MMTTAAEMINLDDKSPTTAESVASAGDGRELGVPRAAPDSVVTPMALPNEPQPPPAKHQKRNDCAIVTTEKWTIFGLTDEHNAMLFIACSKKKAENVRPAAVATGAPKLREWMKANERLITSPAWNWREHIIVLARNIPDDRVLAFKTMLMSDYGTIWNEGNGKCNVHMPHAACFEDKYSSMREELKGPFSKDVVETPLEDAHVEHAMLLQLEADTRDDNNESQPGVVSALALSEATVESLGGSKFAEVVKTLMNKYHKPGVETRTTYVNIVTLNKELNEQYEAVKAYETADTGTVNIEMHKEALKAYERLKNDVHSRAQQLEFHPDDVNNTLNMTYSLVWHRLASISEAVKLRDSVNKNSFKSMMAHMQPTFVSPKTKVQYGYGGAIKNAEAFIKQAETGQTDWTSFQRQQVEWRLRQLKRMKDENAALESLPVYHCEPGS